MSDTANTQLSSWILIVALCGLSFVFLWPTWISLHEFWLASTRFSHGHLIVLIFGYLLFVQRAEISKMPARPCFVAFLPLTVLLAVWLVAVLASIQSIHQTLLPILLWTMLLAVSGWAIAKRLWVQCAYLYLAVPVWESGNFVLQWMTTNAVAMALWLFQVPAYVDGNIVNLRAGAFEVEGGCSGLHYFIIAVALSVFYGLLYLESNRRRLLLIAIAMGMALLTNWLRVFIIVYAGHLTDMQHYLVTHNHYYFGWVLFAVMLIPYLRIAKRMERSEKNVSSPTSIVAELDSAQSTRRPIVAFSLCLLGLAVASGSVHANIPTEVEQNVSILLPNAYGEWRSGDAIDSNWRPHYVGATAEVFERYVSKQGTVDAYKNLYRGQIQGQELVGFHNRIEGSGEWSIVGGRNKRIESEGREVSVSVREVLLVGLSGEKRVLYLWYDVGGHPVVSDLEAKIIYGINVLRGRRDAGVTILSAACGQDCDSASELLRDWLTDHEWTNGGK